MYLQEKGLVYENESNLTTISLSLLSGSAGILQPPPQRVKAPAAPACVPRRCRRRLLERVVQPPSASAAAPAPCVAAAAAELRVVDCGGGVQDEGGREDHP